MTQLTGGQSEQSHAPAAQRAAAEHQSMLRRVLGELMLHVSARIGMVWVGLLALCAIFAPFLASSHPILMRTADTGEPRLTILTRYEPGAWSSPLLRHLTEPDVLLPVALAGLLVVVLWRGVAGGRRALAFVAFAAIVVVLGLWQRHLWPFITAGHETWLGQWRDWREGIERVRGVPPRVPVGLFAWWTLLWMGLGLMLAATVLSTSGLVMCIVNWLHRPRLYWALVAAVTLGLAAWVALLSWGGFWVLLGGVVLGGGAVGLAIAWARGVDGRVLGTLMLVAGLLVGGAMVHHPISPPQLTTLEQYREAGAVGEIDWALMPPIPFSPDDRLYDQRDMRFQAPDSAHLLGTTRLSADLASNMIHGTRIALSVGFISTGIAIVIGVIIGGIMGYFSGVVDLLGMRFVEMFSAIPTLFLLLAFVAAFEANLYVIMIIIGLTSWVGYAVYVRAEFLRLRQQEFIQAAQALGLPLPVVLFRHLLPNGVAPVLVAASFGVAAAIGFEATLSFLGIGLRTEASWGLLLEQALEGGTFHWWITIGPGLAIFLTVFSYVLIGEALRDAIDPRTQTPKD